MTFVAGAPETLIIETPGTALSNPLHDLLAGDRIEFGGGMMINTSPAP